MMHNPKFLYALNQILRVTGVLLIAILIGFEAVPITTESDTQYINQAGLQRTRSQIFTKSVYVLRYRPDVEKALAISDLQITLPLFQQEQSVLLTNTTPDVQSILQAARPDYLALVTAVQAILAHPTAPNSIEIDIVLSHERGYLLTTSSLLSVLQRHIDEIAFQMFCIKVFIEVLLMTLVAASIFTTRRVREIIDVAIEHEMHGKAEE